MSSSTNKADLNKPFVKFISLPPIIHYELIADKLGVSDPKELISEVVEVDQHRLELLINMNLKKDTIYPQEFFNTVMKETSTYIIWPVPWKVNAPYIKPLYLHVVGTKENIPKAKQIIKPVLGNQISRVIMKLDVPHDAHSFLIGARGTNIKAIKEKANIKHVHFPNYRLNPNGNSNEVTMYGSLGSIETARHLLRISSPVIISFVTNISNDRKCALDEMIPVIKSYETKYKVQIILFPRIKSYSILFLIKGVEKDIDNMIITTKKLLKYARKWTAVKMDVQIRFQIAPQHLADIHEISEKIMENTKTRIVFPDLNNPLIKPRKKVFVTISGSVEGVYNAKQQLIGNLPISLVFVYHQDNKEMLFSYIRELNSAFNVLITLESLEKYVFIATIRGNEKHIDNIYKCRQKLLNRNDEYVKPNVPKNYFSMQIQEEDTTNSVDLEISDSDNESNMSSSSRTLSEEDSAEILRDDVIPSMCFFGSDSKQYDLPLTSSVAHSPTKVKYLENQANISKNIKTTENAKLLDDPQKREMSSGPQSHVSLASTGSYKNKEVEPSSEPSIEISYLPENKENQENQEISMLPKMKKVTNWLSLNHFMLHNRTVPRPNEPPPGFEHVKPKPDINYKIKRPLINSMDHGEILPQRKLNDVPQNKNFTKYKFNGSLAPGDERRAASKLKKNI